MRTGKSRDFRSTISWNDEAVEIIFNFVVTILETALKCSPTVAPTKAGEHSDKKINNFDGEIWSMVYSSYLADGEEGSRLRHKWIWTTDIEGAKNR